MPRDLQKERREWLLQRQCALSARQMAGAWVVLCAGALAVAVPLTVLAGYWPILAYAVLEQAALALAFAHQARHRNDRERVVLSGTGLQVEVVTGGVLRRSVRLDPCSLRVHSPRRTGDLIRLEAQGERVALGRFVTEARRRQFAQELQRELMDGWPA
jgi:uncharacterized membrane protein